MAYRVDPLAYWYRTKDGTALVCAPPKCGSSALAQRYFGKESVGDLQEKWAKNCDLNLGPWRACDLSGVHPGLPRYLAVRDPVERFASLWRNKCRDQLTEFGIPEVHGMTPLQLAEHIGRYPFADLHWFPMSAYYAPGVHVMPVAHLLYELGVKSGWNATQPRDGDPPMPVGAIRQLYRADVQLWEACL